MDHQVTVQDPWTDRLSDYLDDELGDDERRAVAAHLAGCAACAKTLVDLRRVAAAAASLAPERPGADLWRGIAARIGSTSLSGRSPFAGHGPRRFSVSLTELAAASLLIAALSGAIVAILMTRAGRFPGSRDGPASAAVPPPGAARPDPAAALAQVEPVDGSVSAAVSFADAQYDAAVADLEQAMESDRGRVDRATVVVVEQSLSTIDRAIAEARSALATEPSNSYLRGHLMEARRRKLAVLRRAAALGTEMK